MLLERARLESLRSTPQVEHVVSVQAPTSTVTRPLAQPELRSSSYRAVSLTKAELLDEANHRPFSPEALLDA